GVEWSTDITLVCDKGAKNEGQPKVTGLKAGVLELEWSVPAACALSGDSDGGSGSGGDGGEDGDNRDKGSSGGILSTVTTIAFFSFALYLVVGVMYKFLVVRARGLDVIPNLAFWREFPYLCTDFAQHVWSMVGNRRHAGYSVV
ncbi:type II membrane protein, partial [Coemansia nantahalensis]